MIEDMLENDQANANKSADHFARCNMSWFEENMVQQKPNSEARGQTWEPKAWDSNGITVIQVNRAIAKRVEVWFRVSFTKSDAIYEKRLEYPEGYDYDDREEDLSNQARV